MKASVVYDSVFGNTEQIARAIGKALGTQFEVEILRASEVKPEQLSGLQLLIVGSPTRGFRPTPAVVGLLDHLPAHGLNGVRVAAFDTRLNVREVKSWILNVLVKFLGSGAFAAKHIADKLKSFDAKVICPPEGFMVTDREGPLKEGELERATSWAKQILAS